MTILPQPLSLCSVDPLDYTVWCSSIPDSTLIVNKDQAIDGVGVPQPTCVVIHEEYDKDIENQSSAKDDSLLCDPPPLFMDIFADFSIHDFACVALSTNGPNHSQNTHGVSASYDNEEDKLFTEIPLHFSSTFSRNAEDEFFCFSSTPLFDSSDHEDTDEIIDFVDRSCHDLFTLVFDNDDDSIIVDFSKPHVYDDLSVDKVETP